MVSDERIRRSFSLLNCPRSMFWAPRTSGTVSSSTPLMNCRLAASQETEGRLEGARRGRRRVAADEVMVEGVGRDAAAHLLPLRCIIACCISGVCACLWPMAG